MYQTALARREDDQALLGSIDVTPTVSIVPPGAAAAMLPQTAQPWWMVNMRGFRPLESTATSIATRSQLNEHIDRLFAAMDQTMVESAEQIWVVPLSAQPAELVGDFFPWAPSVQPVLPPPAQAALAAVTDLQQWLAIGQDQVAALAGYAPRSVKNWRDGMGPYPSTVRRLFDVHALVGSLTRTMGTESARLWLADTGSGEVSRRDRFVDDAGLRTVITEATVTLFEPSTVPPLHDLDFEEEAPVEIPRRPDLFSGPVRRTRRRP